MQQTRTRSLVCATMLVGLGGPVCVNALPVTITTPFINYENEAINSLGFGTGLSLRFGANSVVPNGVNGTTGVATSTDLATALQVSRQISFLPSPANPNFFQRNIPINSNLLGPWTMTFTNGADSAQSIVQLPAGASVVPFVNSITLSGTSENPTFSWSPPPGVTVNGYRINIFDKALVNLDPAKGPINIGQVSSRSLQPNQTSYTVLPSDFTVAGNAFALGNKYSIQISVIQTRDGTSSNLGNANLASISRVYADFTPNAGGGPPVNLPVVLVNGAYQFNMAVQPGQTYYIDPDVAVGYDYAIGDGDPNFRSVRLPVGIGDGLYDIYGYDVSNNLVLLESEWIGGSVYDFGASGVSRFRVTDIETSAGLDPNDTTAFITGLVFTGIGNFTGTQTPITQFVSDVPEPSTFVLMFFALGGLILRRASNPAMGRPTAANVNPLGATGSAQAARQAGDPHAHDPHRDQVDCHRRRHQADHERGRQRRVRGRGWRRCTGAVQLQLVGQHAEERAHRRE